MMMWCTTRRWQHHRRMQCNRPCSHNQRRWLYWYYGCNSCKYWGRIWRRGDVVSVVGRCTKTSDLGGYRRRRPPIEGTTQWRVHHLVGLLLGFHNHRHMSSGDAYSKNAADTRKGIGRRVGLFLARSCVLLAVDGVVVCQLIRWEYGSIANRCCSFTWWQWFLA